MGAKALIFLFVSQKSDDFLKLHFRFVDAGNIGKGDAGFGLHIDLCPRLADTHQAAEALSFGNAAKNHHPQAEEQQ